MLTHMVNSRGSADPPSPAGAQAPVLLPTKRDANGYPAPPDRPPASSVATAGRGRYDSAMVGNQEALGPSVGTIPARVFDAHPATLETDLDRLIGRLRERAQEFARLHVATKIELLEDCLRGTRAVASDWVAAACRAKGIPPNAPVAGEEWVAGPALTLRNMRFLIRSLHEINKHGAPVLREKLFRDLPHGAVGVRVAPYDSFDAALYGGITAETWLQGHRGAWRCGCYSAGGPLDGPMLAL